MKILSTGSQQHSCIRCGANANNQSNDGNWFCGGCFAKEFGIHVPFTVATNTQNTENTEVERLKSELSELKTDVENIREVVNRIVDILNAEVMINNPDYGDELPHV